MSAHVPDPKMTAEETSRNLETCIVFYKQQMEHYHKTQEVEWKGTFGAWALAASAVALTFRNGFTFHPGCWVGLVLFVPACHAAWLWLIHASEEKDKKLWGYYRNEASKLVNLEEKYKNYNGRPVASELLWVAIEAGPTESYRESRRAD